MSNDDTIDIVWSYGVRWEPSPIAWASRWDTYLAMNDSEVPFSPHIMMFARC